VEMRLSKRGRESQLEFSADSAEQIVRSVNMTGLRTEIDQAFEGAITRVKQGRGTSCEPPINETK